MTWGKQRNPGLYLLHWNWWKRWEHARTLTPAHKNETAKFPQCKIKHHTVTTCEERKEVSSAILNVDAEWVEMGYQLNALVGSPPRKFRVQKLP